MSLKIIVNAIFSTTSKDWKKFLIEPGNDSSGLYSNFEDVLNTLNKIKLTNRKENEYRSIFNCFSCNYSKIENVVIIPEGTINTIKVNYPKHNFCKDKTLVINNNIFTNLWTKWVDSLIKKISDEKKKILFTVPDNSKYNKIINKNHTILTYSNKLFLDKLVKNEIIVYTDGSSLNNGSTIARGGYSCVIQIDGKKEIVIYGRVPIGEYNGKILYPTNIRAEGHAILKAINYVNKNYNYETCTIVSDSKFWIDMIESYIPKWDNKKFENKKNTDLTLKFKKININKIKFIFVRSHGKEKDKLQLVHGNELADKYASKGNSCKKEMIIINL